MKRKLIPREFLQKNAEKNIDGTCKQRGSLRKIEKYLYLQKNEVSATRNEGHSQGISRSRAKLQLSYLIGFCKWIEPQSNISKIINNWGINRLYIKQHELILVI